MAVVTRYVNPDSTTGGDGTTNATTGANRAYNSLSEWEAATQQDLATNTTTAECVCETSGTADTTPVTILGWVTNATYYIDIKTSSGHRHPGYWDSNKYRIECTDAVAITATDQDYVYITGLQIARIASDVGVLVNTVNLYGNIRFQKNIVKFVPQATSQDVFGVYFGRTAAGTGTRTVYIFNNLFLDFNSTSGVLDNVALYVADPAASTNQKILYAINNTFVNNEVGFYKAAFNYAYASSANNLFYLNVVDHTGTFYDVACNSTNNATLNYTQSGGDDYENRLNQTFSFENTGIGNYRLTVADTGAIGWGYNFSTSPLPLATDDMFGTDRGIGTGHVWDIGMHEFATARNSSPFAAGRRGLHRSTIY